MSSGIISLEEARQDAAKNLGQQNPNGFRQKSKMQLLKEQHQLEAAQREQGRRHAMNRWYETSKLVVMDIYNHLGFPMHANAGEKMTMVVGALLQLSAQLIASDKSDPAPLVEAFQHLCKMEVDRVAAEELDIRTQKMAAVVGALIENPDLAKLKVLRVLSPHSTSRGSASRNCCSRMRRRPRSPPTVRNARSLRSPP